MVHRVEIMKTVQELNKAFVYKADKKDTWRLMKPNAAGKLEGDCEDYSLWVAFWVIAKGSWAKLWWMVITRQLKFHLVYTKSGGGHCVLEWNGLCIDNIYKRWIPVSESKRVYRFKRVFFITTIWIKMLFSKIFD